MAFNKPTNTNLRCFRENSHQGRQDDFNAFDIAKVTELAKPLKEAGIPYKIHIVKDHDMKERFYHGQSRVWSSDGKLGSVSDYCVVGVRYPEDKENAGGYHPMVAINERKDEQEEEEEEHLKVA